MLKLLFNYKVIDRSSQQACAALCNSYKILRLIETNLHRKMFFRSVTLYFSYKTLLFEINNCSCFFLQKYNLWYFFDATARANNLKPQKLQNLHRVRGVDVRIQCICSDYEIFCTL